VPVAGCIEPACEEALRELERRAYVVRRVRGFSAIDQLRMGTKGTRYLHRWTGETMQVIRGMNLSRSFNPHS
jgi:hypothetical protein